MITEQMYKRSFQGLKTPPQGYVSSGVVVQARKHKTFNTLKIYEHFLKKGFMVNNEAGSVVLRGENAIITINKEVVS